jgi:DNA-binding transcriptional MerR regulator
MADQVVIPDDQEQFKLNEVCKLANVQPYMLRFWGTEFPQLEAGKSSTGQRLYSREQVETILEIRRLLFDEGLTIAGARKKLAAAEEGGGRTKGKPKPEAPKAPKAADEPAAKTAPTTSSARRTVAKQEEAPAKKAPAAAEVDKEPPVHVQTPLVATLKSVRDEIDKIVAELKSE